MKAATPRVLCIGMTEFWYPFSLVHELSNWTPDVRGGEALVEFAGRACYQSWTKPNKATATNRGYINHILEVGHLSVLEHASATFYLLGVSRSFTHELVRHRHLSFSQLSQRYVNENDAKMVIPAEISNDPELHDLFEELVNSAQETYDELAARLIDKHAGVENKTLRSKMARQAARAVLPNATETKIVVTGNHRAWRHFINMRATEGADVEIRRVAIEILRVLQRNAPAIYADYTISTLDDGTEVASTPYAQVT